MMMRSEEKNNTTISHDDGTSSHVAACQTQTHVNVVPIYKHEKSSEMSEETSKTKQWRKPNLSLEIPNRASDTSGQESVHITMPTTPTPTPKRVNFNLSPSRVNELTASTRSKSSFRNILPKLSFKSRTGSVSDTDMAPPSFDSVYSSVVKQDHKPSNIARSWSFSKFFTPRMNRASSLPVTRMGYLNSDSAHGGSLHRHPTLDRKEVRVISRSLSIPIINKEKSITRTNSFFRVIPSTPRCKDCDSDLATAATEDDGNNEDIPEDEAVCRICFVELCEGGETLKMECSCKGELALAHQDCAVKWFAIKGNQTCDICQQEVLNLPVTLLRIQSTINRNSRARNFGQMEINGYRVWQDLPILVIVSILGYFCFLEQLLAKSMHSSSIAVSVPFSCLLGLLASLTSSTVVKRRFVWVYALIQFALVVVFGHIFYNLVHVHAIASIFLSTFAGFGAAMSGGTIIVEALRWRGRRWQVVTNLNEMTNEPHPSQAPPPSQIATPSYTSPRLRPSEQEHPETFRGS